MNTFFLVCALLGGGTLLLQLVLSVFGIVDGHGEFGHHDHPASEGLDLFSVRALAAGLALFGVGAMFGAWGTWHLAWRAGRPHHRWCRDGRHGEVDAGDDRLEANGTVMTEEAIGEQGTVYLTIPADGRGKVVPENAVDLLYAGTSGRKTIHLAKGAGERRSAAR